MEDFKNWIIVFLAVLALVETLALIFTINPGSNKNEFLLSIPGVKTTYVNALLEYEPLNKMLTSLTCANGIENDDPTNLIKEATKSIIIGLLMALFMVYIKQNVIAIILFAFMCLYPFIRRVMDKKDYHKKYIAGFYTFLNYITQYLSGGVEMRQALIEVEKLIPEDNVIKPKLKDAISRNAITGFDGDSYIAALQELNKGLDYSEINTFISTARRSETNGDAISETLLDQINDIYKRVEIEKRGHIAGYESKFGVMIVLFGMLSCLAMFCISIFASAILSLGAI